MKTKRIFLVKNCLDCPNLETRRTLGAGYAVDYLCGAKKGGPWSRLIKGYVENASEEPKNYDFPKWCPLKEDTRAK